MKTNYHTHTTWCDGNDNAESMIRSAIEKKFDVLGFSGHAMYPFAVEWQMSALSIKKYAEEIRELAVSFADTIEILLGFEADYFPVLSTPSSGIYKEIKPDFLIGSVHFLFDEKTVYTKNPEGSGIPYTCFTADGPEEEVAAGIQQVFKGNAKKAVQTYFSLQRDMIKDCTFDIVGHIDVIRKRNGTLRFFNEQDSWYISELKETAKTAALYNKVVEINTGGIARGVINDSYPSIDFLKILKSYNVPVCLNSDAHSTKDLDCAFDISLEKAKTAGYTELMYLSGGSWKTRKL